MLTTLDAFFSFLDRYRISISGIALGLFFLAASTAPSLIPRSALIQGVLGAIVMALGYLLVVVLIWIWTFLELPKRFKRLQNFLESLFLIAGLTSAAYAFSILRASQNELRELFTMAPLKAGHELSVIATTAGLFCTLLLFGRIVTTIFKFLRNRIPQRVPPRVSFLISFILVALISWNIGNGVIARGILTAADEAMQEVDALIDPDLPPPDDSLRSGSSESLIQWNSLGARGRQFIAGGLSGEEISKITSDKEAKNPIRVYAGLNSAETTAERAELVLKEMIRVRAFERSTLVIVTPTGTGWIDPQAVDPLEVLHRGDLAIVGMQYSYLMSPLAVLVEPEQSPESAQALVNTIYDYWRKLPSSSRPKLYLHGLSLGSYGSENAMSPLNMIDDPISGALWSGPTFGNPIWKDLTRNRNPDSPAWLPRIGDARTARFTTQHNALEITGADWSRMRLIVLQYPSDPITFFEVAAAIRPSDWMLGELAPDVLQDFKWYPLITMLQLAVDMLICTDMPKGYGHVFAAEHYIDSWVALSDPQGWPQQDLEQLKNLFR